MKPEQRIVTELPLRHLWDTGGAITGTHDIGPISAEEIRNLLRSGPVVFVVADVGLPLTWIDPARAFDFWKHEVRPRLVDPARERALCLDDFPGSYGYLGRRWRAAGYPQLVVLEKQH